MPTVQPVPDSPENTKKGKKKWLVALLAASLAVVEVVIPHASPLAELLVRLASPLVLQAAPNEASAAVQGGNSAS